MSKFLSLFFGLISAPRKTLRLIPEGKLSYGILSYLIFSSLYAMFAFILFLQGVEVRNALAAFIPPKEYYLWETFFMIPVCFFSYFLFSVLAYLLSKSLGGTGSFDATLAVIGFTYSVPLIALFWVPDMLFFLVSRNLQLALVPWYGSISTVWMVVLTAWGLTIVHGIKLRSAVLVTLVSAAFGNVLTALVMR